MNSKLQILLWTLIIITSSLFGYNKFYLQNQIEKKVRNNTDLTFKKEIDYLSKNLDISFKKNLLVLPTSNEEKILIFIPKSACSSCVEEIFRIFIDLNINNEVVIYVEILEQVEYNLAYNDKFNTSFHSIISELPINTFSSDILIYTSRNSQILNLLKFSSGDQIPFIKYFTKYFL